MTSKLKILVCLLGIVGVLFISPEHLFSQAAPENPAATTTPAAPAGRSTAPRSTTTLPPRAPTQNTPQTPQPNIPVDLQGFQKPSMITQGTVLVALTLLPFAVIILTSFLKIVVVLSLLRTALGVQQSPPNQIINGVAFMLSLFIMYPTGLKMYDAAQKVVIEQRAPESLFTPDSSAYLIALAKAASAPFEDFLKRNSSVKHQALFYRIAYRILPEHNRTNLKPDDVMILVPSFITSQLKDAFEIGVLIYIPFFVIDLVTSNILLAMGMMMLSPVTISMPLKLFLLVMLDGWTLLIEGLVNTFR